MIKNLTPTEASVQAQADYAVYASFVEGHRMFSEAAEQFTQQADALLDSEPHVREPLVYKAEAARSIAREHGIIAIKSLVSGSFNYRMNREAYRTAALADAKKAGITIHEAVKTPKITYVTRQI